MKIYLLLLFSIFFSLYCSTLEISAQTRQSLAVNFEEGINLDKTEVIIPCPPQQPSPFKCPKDALVKVKTNITSSMNKITYEYSVTGGLIIGKGKNVKWNLSNARPGIHTITVTVRDNKDFKKAFSKRITAPSCGSCGIWDCVCPTLTISVPAENPKVGDKITFTANVSGSASDTKFTYKWKISGGKIIRGQGTPFVTVKVNKSVENSVTAGVKIGGACAICVDTTNETIDVIPKQ